MKSSRRSDLPTAAVHSLDHVGFDVPDLEEARRFYSTFGLDVKDGTDPAGAPRLEVSTHNDPRPWLFIGKSGTTKKKLTWISFGAYEEDLPAIHARLEKLATKATAPKTREPHAMFYEGPHGVVVEVRATPKRTPRRAGRPGDPSAREPPRRAAPFEVVAGEAHAPLPCARLLPRPGRDGRLLHRGARPAGLRRLARHRLSPRAARLRPSHHRLRQGPASGLHHVSWSVPSFDDVGLGKMQMAAQGYDRGWGVGRHVLGSNYFQYVRDPWGSYSEYSFDIDHIPLEHRLAGEHAEPGRRLLPLGVPTCRPTSSPTTKRRTHLPERKPR